MAYRLSRVAERDLLLHYAEGVETYGAEHTERYFADLEKTCAFLSHFPEAARERVEITPPVRIYRFKSHLIVYVVEPSRDILVLRIRHGREDWVDNPA
ncbi:MAG: type II toxin-antitoxin system RelE/ParE family toxin [Pseudomonadota bacterium]